MKPFRILLLFLCLFVFNPAIAQIQAIRLTGKTKKLVIGSIARELKANYIYQDTANRMADFISHQYKAGAYDSIKTPDAFAAKLTADLLSVYHDGHLYINFDPRVFGSKGTPDSITKKDEQVRMARFRKRVNFGFDKAEVLPGNTGYLKIGGFFTPDKESIAMTDAALRFVSNGDALIIDLRNNMGGDPTMVSHICSFLFKNKIHLNDLYSRKDKSTTAYWTKPDSSITTLTDIPVYILISKTTFSAGEELTYDLQAQKRALVIGETTGGGAHPVAPFNAGNGFVANIPYARAINPVTKTNWETVGVKPDIVVPADDALKAALNKIAAGKVDKGK